MRRALVSQSFSMKHIKILAKVGPSGRPIPSPSTWLQSTLLKIKYELKAISRNDRKWVRGRPATTLVGLGKRLSKQMLIGSRSGTFVNKLSMSKEAITNWSAFGTLLKQISKLVRVIDSAFICGQRGKVRDQILRKAKGWGVSSKNWTKLKLTEKN